MLALLQRDGRLIDFLAEDISLYPDGQLGAAVRTIHETCRQVLDRYLKLEPILNSDEDQPVTVQAGFDPAAIKLIGNVAGEPPVRGVLRHKGWRVKEMNLPPLPQGAGRMVSHRRRSNSRNGSTLRNRVAMQEESFIGGQIHRWYRSGDHEFGAGAMRRTAEEESRIEVAAFRSW